MAGSRNRVKDYKKYELHRSQLFLYTAVGFGIVIVLSSAFYHSCAATIIMSPLVIFYLREKKEELCEKQKSELNEQFKEAIMAVSNGLRAGYSIENAFREAYRDVKVMFGEESNISKELFHIRSGLENNVLLEKLLFDLAKRSSIDNILDFAEIFQIAKRSGGDMNNIIQSCVLTICDKIEVKKEIETLLCAKQLEQKIMNLIPILIILYIRGTSPEFFNPLYHNIIGIVIMSICLILYGAAYKMAKDITTIQL